MNDINNQWNWKMVKQPDLVLKVIEKAGTAHQPVIDMKISAVNRTSPPKSGPPNPEFHVFYLQGPGGEPLAGWNWKQAGDPDDVCRLLNGETPGIKGVVDARICGYSVGSGTEFYIFYRPGKREHRWFCKRVKNSSVAAALLSGTGDYTLPVIHAEIVAAGENDRDGYYLFYRQGLPGQPPDPWPCTSGTIGSPGDLTKLLNRETNYPTPVRDGKVVTLFQSGNGIRYLVFYPPGFLIITRPVFVGSLKKYIEWKHAKGFEIYVVTAEWIDAHVPGDNLVFKMRNCIRHYLKKTDLKYALLIGDSVNFDFDLVPPPPVLSESWNLPVGWYYNPEEGWYEPTSFFFSDPSDTTELIYPQEQRDFSVATGVIPVRTTADLTNVLNKTMNATRTRQVSLIFSEDVFSSENAHYAQALQVLANNNLTISTSAFGPSATEPEIKAAIFEPPGVLMEKAHGTPYTFMIGAVSIDQGDAHLFQNINPLFIMNSCWVFNYFYVTESIIETFLRAEKGPAVIIPSTLASGSSQPPPLYGLRGSEISVWQDLFNGKTIGQAIYDNRKTVLTRFSLFGDPSLVIFDKS